jgi:hypothetical protein
MSMWHVKICTNGRDRFVEEATDLSEIAMFSAHFVLETFS